MDTSKHRKAQLKTGWRWLAGLFLGAAMIAYFVSIQRAQVQSRSTSESWHRLCSTASTIEVCAHRGAAPELGFPFPNRTAIRAAWEHKIYCFDIDVMQTMDGHLIIAHLDALAKSLQGEQNTNKSYLSGLSLVELRAKGANEFEFPELEQVLEEFSRLMEEKDMSGRWPMISIELKGSSLNEDAIERVLSSARRLSLLPNLFFWFRLEPEDNGFKLARMVKQQEPDVHIGIVYKDALSTDLVPVLKPEIRQNVADLFDTIVPSIKLEQLFFAEARKQKMIIATWTVNSADHMWKSLQVGAQFGISERPLQYKQLVKYVVGKCENKRKRHAKSFITFVS